ncbi:hypothetical protein SAMN04487926_1613 [Paraburkholderia steynii]|uniref:Uncharacterized protein n=1 Tax=Paraburkholderia steynii TaxID=1245441 RepID=A0A7Z7BLP3_9BURK|nr:hypothetical protein SAMN04487926_1613 [Paraburkholderia steynii]
MRSVSEAVARLLDPDQLVEQPAARKTDKIKTLRKSPRNKPPVGSSKQSPPASNGNAD